MKSRSETPIPFPVDEDGNVTISKEMYDALLLRDKTLAALECGGVDNWTWYGESLENARRDGLLPKDDD